MQTSSVTTEPHRRVGFAGLGAMGLGMATNLVKAGFSVTGFDVFPPALDRFFAVGGQTASSIFNAGRGQTRFFVMVASPEQVDGLVEDLCTSLHDSAILCLFSTLPPSYVVNLVERLKALGRSDIRLLDCPVSGGFVGARDGKLSVCETWARMLASILEPC